MYSSMCDLGIGVGVVYVQEYVWSMYRSTFGLCIGVRVEYVQEYVWNMYRSMCGLCRGVRVVQEYRVSKSSSGVYTGCPDNMDTDAKEIPILEALNSFNSATISLIQEIEKNENE